MIKNKFLQFELWKNCNNNCKFCIHKLDKVSSDEQKISDVKYFQNEMMNPENDEYDVIGFIGGEFFDDQLDNENVKKEFYKLFDICADKYKHGKIRRVFITASLIYDIDKILMPFILYLKQIGLLDIVVFCTSYDLKYRFHSIDDENVWKNNVMTLNKMMTNKVHVEIILTKFFIDSVLNQTFDITQFIKQMNVDVDYIEPSFIAKLGSKQKMIDLIPDFFPSRNSFLKFMKKTVVDDNSIDIDRLISMTLRSDALYYKNGKDNNILKAVKRHENNLRKYDQYGIFTKKVDSYVDSNISMEDDIKNFRELIK